jgi:hypothetical protein
MPHHPARCRAGVRRGDRNGLECATSPQPAPLLQTVIDELECQDREIGRLLVEQIPCVGVELVTNAVDEALRADEPNGHWPPEAEPKQVIEAREMIHVRVGYENIRDAQDLARGKRVNVAEIE